MGSDCPGLSPERIREAADALARADVVVGPALDGGYYLIGMTRPREEFFRDIPWSTAEVVGATRRRIAETGARARFLPSERDVDTPRDLFEWYAEAQAARVRESYPRTWSVLHAALPPRRFAELESALRPEPGEGR